MLYHEPGLRRPLLRGLKAIIDGNAAALKVDMEGGNESDDASEGEDMDAGSEIDERAKDMDIRRDEDVPLITEEEARKNIEYLNKQAKSWLAVLFNVFTGMEKESRSMVGEVISAWAGIANEPVCPYYYLAFKYYL